MPRKSGSATTKKKSTPKAKPTAKPAVVPIENDPPEVFHEFGLDLWDIFCQQGFTTVSVIKEYGTEK